MPGIRRFDLVPTRVTQLDAITLDNEIFNILKAQLRTILLVLPPWILKEQELKIDLLIHYVLWKLSICKFKASFGHQLLNMKYRDYELSIQYQRILLLYRIISYLQNNNLFVSISPKINHFAKTFDIIFHVLEAMNLLLFFLDGKYPTVVNRLLRLRLYNINETPRPVGYSYMTRELIWHGFLELLTFTLSIINYQYFKKSALRIIFRFRKIPAMIGQLNFTVDSVCIVCSNPPVMPHHMGCSHVFCYYCIQTNRLVDPEFECPACNFFRREIECIKQ